MGEIQQPGIASKVRAAGRVWWAMAMHPHEYQIAAGEIPNDAHNQSHSYTRRVREALQILGQKRGQ